METSYYPYQKGPDGYFHLGSNTLGTIRTRCLQTGTLYEDPEFPPTYHSVFGGDGGSGNEIRWRGSIFWKRPVEITSYPQFIADGVSRFDVIQGELGNCWFIAATCNLTMHQSLFSQVVPMDNGNFRPGEYCGAFHFRFWQYGHWIDIIVDDRLPCNRRGEILFQHSSDSREFWSALLEKAYAKLHGSYASLTGGTPSEALQDFSGGIIEAVDIDQCNTDLFGLMRKAYTRSSLMSCSLSGRGGRYEERTRDGLVKGHAYSVTAVEMVAMSPSYRGSNAPLVRIRNPWGDHFEWKGPWSDSSREWSLVHPAERARLGVTNQNDGEFWMHIDDFQKHFTRLEICHMSPDPIDARIKPYGRPWHKEIIRGSWVRGVSAGGCLNYPSFAQNPQYFFHFEASDEDGDADKCTVIVGLLQKRPKRASTNPATKKAECIGFRMYKVNAYYRPGEKLDLSFFKRPGTRALTSGDFIDSREVSARFEVATGNYCIVPSTFDPDVEGEFLLRVFSEPSTRPLPAQYTITQYASQHGGTVDNAPISQPHTAMPNHPTAPSLPQSGGDIVNFPNPYANTRPPPANILQPSQGIPPNPFPNNYPGYPPIPSSNPNPPFPSYPYQPNPNMPHPTLTAPSPSPSNQVRPNNTIGFVFGQNM